MKRSSLRLPAGRQARNDTWWQFFNRHLDEVIEEQKKRADKEQDGAAVDFAAANAAELPKKTSGQHFEARFLTKSGAFAECRAMNDFIADGADFVVHPDGDIFAASPEKSRTVDKKEITNKGKNTESGTGTPKHKPHQG